MKKKNLDYIGENSPLEVPGKHYIREQSNVGRVRLIYDQNGREHYIDGKTGRFVSDIDAINLL